LGVFVCQEKPFRLKAFMPYLAAVLITLLLATPAFSHSKLNRSFRAQSSLLTTISL
jgi:hypothetical protein